ncbi:MAG: pentapeptide repeat-containing protein [Calothrix sp. MO_167.B12]|nr:pentapeptide repeat-containing protein [Calothrix sp. MO_167.B12]
MTESPKKVKFSSRFYTFFYNLLPKCLSPSTKKGILQISGAFSLTIIIFMIVIGVESTFKVKQSQSTQAKNQENQATQVEKPQNNQKNQTPENKCKYNNVLLCIIGDSKILGQVQNFAVLVAAWLYLFDVFDRKKQVERQAWQLIDGARGSNTSGARYEAIKDLFQEGISLNGLDANRADLIKIELPKAKLRRANFKCAELEGANLEEADLYQANLEKADLRGAKLVGANLSRANLKGAKLNEREYIKKEDNSNDNKYNEYDPQVHETDIKKRSANLENCKLRWVQLQNANLNNANLSKAKLHQADLQEAQLVNTILDGADLYGANLKNTILDGANLYGANLEKTTYLTIEQLRKARNYKKANYDESFRRKYPELQAVDNERKNIGVEANQAESPEIKSLKSLFQIIITNTEIRQKLIELLNSDVSVIQSDDALLNDFLQSLQKWQKTINEDESLSLSDSKQYLKIKISKIISDLNRDSIDFNQQQKEREEREEKRRRAEQKMKNATEIMENREEDM